MKEITSIAEEEYIDDSRKERRRKDRTKRKVKGWVKLLIALIVLGVIAALLFAPPFDVKNYEVIGNNYYTDEEIILMGNCKTGENIIIGTDCREIKKRLDRDAYMQDVKITRKLPATIKIELKERKQVGACVYGPEYIVVDENGIVLRKASIDPKLTIIRGLKISKLVIGEEIEVEETPLLKETLEMLDCMNEHNMYFKEIQFGNTDIKAYILDSLVCIGTPDNIMEALETEKLQKVVQSLFDDKIEKGTIKLSGDNYISFSKKVS